jgi:diaminohydroxyphosphoribosylaminopyrimidine deaminase/5-amino-6-(5-phosphoribosylamino)uracil reductase
MGDATPLSDADGRAMQDALACAEQAIGLSDPNPRVGCVLVGAGGWRARGSTQAAGDAHAEVMALRAARTAGHDIRGATAYVTLEPCAHHGRTPPCCDALIEAGIARAVVLLRDPNPQVGGRGIERLRGAGIEVVFDADPARLAAARELNIGFLSRMQRGRPWVRMKIAASLDGRTALADGSSQWITGPAARTDGHAYRKRASVVLSGAGTVLEDDPRLDVRLVVTARQPLRAIIDSRLDTPLSAQLFDASGPLLFYAAAPDPARVRALEARSAEVVLLPNADGKVDLVAALRDLAHRDVNELHVEAGHRLNASLLALDLVDELLVYMAPKLLGSGRDMAAFGPLRHLDEARAFEFTQVDRIGEDLRLIARPPGRAAFAEGS